MPRVRLAAAHCGRRGGHRIQIDQDGEYWPTVAPFALELLDSDSVKSFAGLPGCRRKLAVYLWSNPSGGALSLHAVDVDRAELVGFVVMSSSRSALPITGASSGLVFNIHGLAIKRTSGRGGAETVDWEAVELETARAKDLYEFVHLLVFEQAQKDFMLRVTSGEVLEPRLRLELDLCCRRSRPSSLEALLVGVDAYPLDQGYFTPPFDRGSAVMPTESMQRLTFGQPNVYNDKIRSGELLIGPNFMPPSQTTGLVSFFVPSAPCRALEEWLWDPANHGVLPLEATGHDFAVDYLAVGRRIKLHGFALYGNVQVEGGDRHSEALQSKRTIRTRSKAGVKGLLLHAPGFAALTRAVLHRLGYPAGEDRWLSMLLGVHFFLVDDTRQTSFGWHTDDTDLDTPLTSDKGKRALRSAVIQLGAETRTAMQVHGFNPFVFEGRGTGAIFHGAALHRSVNLDPPPRGHGIWKVTYFLKLIPAQGDALPEQELAPFYL
jgi:hypothetical protein